MPDDSRRAGADTEFVLSSKGVAVVHLGDRHRMLFRRVSSCAHVSSVPLFALPSRRNPQLSSHASAMRGNPGRMAPKRLIALYKALQHPHQSESEMEGHTGRPSASGRGGQALHCSPCRNAQELHSAALSKAYMPVAGSSLPTSCRMRATVSSGLMAASVGAVPIRRPSGNCCAPT